MDRLTHILIAALAAACILSCTKSEETVSGSDDQYWASAATIGSSDSAFASTDGGGTVTFGPDGGSVAVNVSCGIDWIAESHASDKFDIQADVNSGTLTVTAPSITETEEQTGTVTLMTLYSRIEFATLTIVQEAYVIPVLSIGADSWHAPAKGALTAEISVESSLGDYDVESDCDWLTAERTGDGIALSASENDDTSDRIGTVTLSCRDDYRTVSASVTVTQDGAAYITLGRNPVNFSRYASSGDVSVKSNYDWDFSYDTSVDWLTVERSESGLTMTVTENSSDSDREATVTLTAGDGAENAVETVLTVVQGCPATANPMILEYTVTRNAKAMLPLALANGGAALDCIVNWGDGSIEPVTSAYPTHTYAEAGVYDIEIEGSAPCVNNYYQESGITSYLTAVKSWGSTGLVTMQFAFWKCANLTSVPTDEEGVFADVTSFAYAFSGCTSLAAIPEGIFDYASKVTSFEFAFYEDTSLTSIPDGLFDACTEVVSFSNTFYRCSSITSIPAGLFDHCSKVTTFYYTFYGCKAIDGIPEGLFDSCTEVTVFSLCFNGCSKITSIPEGLFDHCTKATRFMQTFESCSKLSSVPARLFANCPLVTDFSRIFSICTYLTSVPGDIFDGCSNVTTFQNAFYYTRLTAVPEGLFDSCSSATNFNSVFCDCTRIASIPENLFAACKKATNFMQAFYGCTALKGESAYDLIEVDGVQTKVHLYERLSDAYKDYYPDVSSITNTHCYTNCTGLDDWSAITSAGWN